MATAVTRKTLKSINPLVVLRTLSSTQNRHFTAVATAGKPEPECPSAFTFSADQEGQSKKTNDDDSIYVRAPKLSSSSVTMPMAFMTGSIAGKRFYKKVTTREADDERQVEKIDPILNWLESEFGFKPVVYSSFFGGKQEDGLVHAIESLLKKMDDYELAAIDAIASAAHSLTISIGIFLGRLQIEEAIELIRLEEDLQVDRWGLVEGGHDVDIADLRVQISSAAVFLGLTRRP
ncbi:hypothetical protein TEA_023911 [Camellia sinensis var. sinensis]|uniref:ATP synthase mitochondrial F1 complex assembly factor 2 n=1 Tax=Camellia sinensis var. sinensis TaxID=542762 RepID=A0A4S4ECK7_CAMSN|nr:hypothetical protein TEA_023911 [Camellia sinensis var. sinensis]